MTLGEIFDEMLSSPYHALKADDLNPRPPELFYIITAANVVLPLREVECDHLLPTPQDMMEMIARGHR